jgi:hypothetical protein
MHSICIQNAFKLHSNLQANCILIAFRIAFQIACELHSNCIKIAFWANAKAKFWDCILGESQKEIWDSGGEPAREPVLGEPAQHRCWGNRPACATLRR